MFKIFQENKTISWILSQKKYINFSPAYQRRGNVWGREQKQLLIDSIINGYDIPKLYFQFMPQDVNATEIYNYAVIDGKQRLEAILDFVEDRIAISKDFKFINSNESQYYIDIAGKKFSEIDTLEPSIIAKFLNYELCIVFMDTTTPDSINEIFIRLNSGVAVNTAEKRNAIGGKLSKEMNDLYSNSPFFTQKIRMDNKRYAHFDLALKFLMIEMGYENLSKAIVDKFVLEQKNFGDECRDALDSVKNKLARFISEFDDKDKLLSRKSLIVTLYSIIDQVPQGKLKTFIYYFELNREIAVREIDKDKADPKMLEFSRQLQQGADKKASLDGRKEIMLEYLHKYLQLGN